MTPAIKLELAEKSVIDLSPKWLSLFQDVERFERTHYLQSIAGRYILRCPLLQDTYPNFEGQLSINIIYYRNSSMHNGIFQVHLDLGTFVGTVMLGLDQTRLSEHLWKIAKKGPKYAPEPATHNVEMRRLRDEAFQAKILQKFQDEAEEGNEASEPSSDKDVEDKVDQVNKKEEDLTPIHVDICQTPKLFFQFRVEDRHGLFMKSGTYFCDRGTIAFGDVRCLRLDGSINLPMISNKRVLFEGFQVYQQPRPWDLCKA